ncbi:MAG: peptidase S58 [Chloroflexi bacterium]|nr:peptidase S58 [Chloroflexota bacterium]MDP6498134.1 P1 family peptidase [Dehalococcoidia bacterium]MQG55207.1 P1 family peptidase [SAR202 cluster bacterium]
MNQTITAVTGLEAGHHTDLEHATGCTVFLCREGAVGGVDVRGGSPGTRETDLLRPVHRVDQVHAVVLSGGSAFGLDAASGVVAYLESQGIGFKVGPEDNAVTVPIVSSAILYDLGLITSEVRPGPEEGRRACLTASTDPMTEGSVGAGTGATVAKLGGPARGVKGGIGSAAITLSTGQTVAVAVAVNAVGGIFDYTNGQILAGPRRADGGFDDPVTMLLKGGANALTSPVNTTIGLVATDAQLTREDANYLARVSHDGLALSIRPCHTVRDGDTMFAMATGHNRTPADLTSLGAAAVEATAQAVLRGVRQATGLGGIPSIRELAT